MNKIFIIVAAVLGIAVGSGGTLAISKAVTPKIIIPACPQAPPCNCPAAISLIGGMDIQRLNNKKGEFTYSPTLTDVTVILDCSDSVLLKQIAKQIGK